MIRAFAASVLLLACSTPAARSPERGEPQAATATGEPRATTPTQASGPPATKRETGEQRAARTREALVGKPAPDATLHLLDGGRTTLRDRIGREPVYLKFWATWCTPCRKQMPHLEATYRAHRDRLAVFAVDLGVDDPVEIVRAFQAENALTVPIAIDGDGSLAERYRVTVLPLHLLIDRTGIVRYAGHEASSELDRALEALVADRPEANASRPADATPDSLIASGASGASPPDPTIPAADVPLSLTLLDGTTFTLAAYAGRPIALTFVSAWCDTFLAKKRPGRGEVCAAHARRAESLRRANPRVVWVTISHPVWTSPGELDEYRTRVGIGTPIGLDDHATWFRHFRVRDVPTTILLDGRGVEAARILDRGDDLPRALTLLLGGAIDVP